MSHGKVDFGVEFSGGRMFKNSEPEVFPSVMVGNIFLHLRQSKLLVALLRRWERRSPSYQGWKLLPFYLNYKFLGVTEMVGLREMRTQ